MQSTGHTLEQAKTFLEHAKYQALATIVDHALLSVGTEEVSVEDQLTLALDTLAAYPEVSTLVNVIKKKLNA